MENLTNTLSVGNEINFCNNNNFEKGEGANEQHVQYMLKEISDKLEMSDLSSILVTQDDIVLCYEIVNTIFSTSVCEAQTNWLSSLIPALRLADTERDILNNLVHTVMGAQNNLTTLIDLIGNTISDDNLPTVKMDITHNVDVSTRRAVIWLLLSIAIISYYKYPEEKITKICLFIGISSAIYFESNEIKAFAFKLINNISQSGSLVNLIIEGASLFIFGSNSFKLGDDITKVIENLGMINSKSEGFSKFVTRVIEWLESLLNIIGEHIGMDLKMSNNIYDIQIQSITSRLIPLERKQIEDELFKSNDYNIASTLYDESQRLYQECVSRKDKGRLTPTETAIRTLNLRAQNVFAYAKKTYSNPGEREMEPFLIMLTGAPGVGKDTYVTDLAEILTVASLDPDQKLDYRVDPTAYAPYTKSESDKYWSGFKKSTRVLVMPDVFSIGGVKGDPDSAANQFLHLVSAEKMALNMADLDSKGKNFADFKAIVATTNYAGGSTRPFDEIHDVGALHRRLRGHTWIMYPADAFSKEPETKSVKSFDIIGDNKEKYLRRLDYAKLEAHLRDHPDDEHTIAYRFRAYDIEKCKIADNSIEYNEEEFTNMIIDELRKHMTSKTNLANKKRAYRNHRINQFLAQSYCDSFDCFYEAQGYFSDAINGVADTWRKFKNKYITPDACVKNVFDGQDILSCDDNGKLELADTVDSLRHFLIRYVNACEEHYSRVNRPVYVDSRTWLDKIMRRERFSLLSVTPPSLDDVAKHRGVIRSNLINYIIKNNRFSNPYIGKSSIDVSGLFVSMFDRFSRLPLYCLKKLLMVENSVSYLALYDMDSVQLINVTQSSNSLSLTHQATTGYISRISQMLSSVPISWWGVAGLGLFTFGAASISLKGVSLVKRLFNTLDPEIDNEPLVAQAFPVNSNEDRAINKLIKNQYYMQLHLFNNDDNSVIKEELNFCLFIKDRYCVTVGHSITKVKELYLGKNYTLFVACFSSANLNRNVCDFKADFDSIRFHPIEAHPDLLVMEFPKETTRQFPDISHALASLSHKEVVNAIRANTQCHYRYVDVDGAQRDVRSHCTTVPMRVYTTPGSVSNAITGTIDRVDIKNFSVSNALCTNVSFPGACGLGVMMNIKVDRNKYPRTNQPLITHIHCAGALATNIGICIPIFLEYFEFIPVKVVDPFDRLTYSYDLYADIALKHGVNKDFTPFREKVNLDKVSIGQDVIAVREVASFSKPSAIIKSPFNKDEEILKLFEDLQPGIHDDPAKPAVLKCVRVEQPDGSVEFVNVAEKAFMPYGNNVRGSLSDNANILIASIFNADLIRRNGEISIPSLLVNPVDMKYCIEHSVDFSNKSLHMSSLMEWYFRIVRGHESDDPILRRTCLDRTKSLGPSLHCVTGLNTRQDIYGDGMFPEFGSNEELAVRDIYFSLAEKLLAGEEITVIMKGCLKDELRPRSRVIIGKTRLFSNGDWAFLILCNVLLGDCVYNHKHKRIKNGMLVGINPFDREEWTKIAEPLLAMNEQGLVGATDHSGFDTDCREVDFSNFLRYIKLYYSDCPDFRDQRILLLTSMFNYFMIINTGDKETVYNMSKALCSGWYITSLFGSYKNLYSHYLSFMSIKAKKIYGNKALILNELDANKLRHVFNLVSKEVCTFVYGDDCIYSTSELSTYSIDAVCEEMSNLIGSRLTNENDDVDENGFVHLTKSVIIARSFNPMTIDDKDCYVANLRYSSILKMLLWDKKDSERESLLQKLDLAYREMSLHGRDVHTRFVNVMRPKTRELYNYISMYEDYDIAISEVLKTIYVPYDGDTFVSSDDE